MDRMFAYKMLLSRRSIEGLSDEAALKHIERLSEAAARVRKADGLRQSIGMAEELLARRTLGPVALASLHYMMSEAWEKLRVFNNVPVEPWEQPEIERELYHLRLSAPREALRELPRERLCQTLSNAAALLNHVGRFSEAIEHWDRALSIMPSHAMARGKKGYALTHYALSLYDKSQLSAFLKCARAELGTSLELGLYDEAQTYFQARLRWVENRMTPEELHAGLDLDDYDEGSSEAELMYRRWCLDSRLFLNPLNDLGAFPIAARDTLQVPPAIASDNHGTYFQGFFNQMKQAYVSARYLYYDGLNTEEAHFSDRHVMLFDTMDCASYSLSVEKIKAAYRIAYGLTNKAARFVNLYMNLGVPDDKLTFRTLWYNSQNRAEGLRPEFAERRNWPLRGLFWLSKDLFEEGLGEPMEPGARELKEILYNMEHRYLRLYDSVRPGFGQDTDSALPAIEDQMVFSMRRGEFEARTLRLLKLVRSALMYLALSVHIEERAKRPATATVPLLALHPIDDINKT